MVVVIGSLIHRRVAAGAVRAATSVNGGWVESGRTTPVDELNGGWVGERANRPGPRTSTAAG